MFMVRSARNANANRNRTTQVDMGFDFTLEQAQYFTSERFADFRARYAEAREKYSDSLRLQTVLRSMMRGMDVGLLRAATAQCELSERARKKIVADGQTLFTAKGLEQASSTVTAQFHASFFSGVNGLADLCSGIGIDAIELGRRAEQIVCVEEDAVSALMLRWNLDRNGVASGTVLQGDVRLIESVFDRGTPDAIFADPDRRPAARRTRNPEAYSPPLSFFSERFRSVSIVAKISPASVVEAKEWKRMFVAVEDECRELLLIRGFDVPELSVADARTGETWIPDERQPARNPSPQFLIEPHSAIIRSGAVRAYFSSYYAVPIDPMIAYGMTDFHPAPSRWHRSFHVVEELEWNKRSVQRAITRHALGKSTEIKKRGFPLLPDEFRKQFRFDGEHAGVLICTRIGEKHVVFICERI